MSADDLNVKIQSKEIEIVVDEVQDAEIIFEPVSDVIVSVESVLDLQEIRVDTAETEIIIQEPPDLEFSLDPTPDTVILVAGNIGPMGPEGPPGEQTTYTFTQVGPISFWNIAHNLGRYPSVTVVDSGGSEIIPNIVYNSPDAITLGFANPTSGKAYLN